MTAIPPRPRDELLTAAARLSRAAPKSWEEFMQAFAKVAGEHRDACVQAPADRVLLTQGKAQLITELLALFQDAPKTK